MSCERVIIVGHGWDTASYVSCRASGMGRRTGCPKVLETGRAVMREANATHRARDRIVARNDLWTAWLRLHRRDACRVSLGVLRRRSGCAGALAAIAGLPWVIRSRKVVPTSVSREFADLATARRCTRLAR